MYLARSLNRLSRTPNLFRTMSFPSDASNASTTSASSSADKPNQDASRFSVFADSKSEIHQVPMSVIIRPFPSLLDEEKVNRFISRMDGGDDDFTPIEILRVRIPGSSASYYYSLGGCHRFEAAKRRGDTSIRGKIIEVPPSVMRSYLGAGAPF